MQITKKINFEQKEQQMAQAKARKTRMVAMDQERSAKIKPSALEQETKEKDLGLLSKA